ncbi:hypothetical protein AYO44_09450 [Planctomycetaceae bacterium SCGC AG-212-F19]|nr:hypothetical protein AYO44_09450 [Planctomycetaceae bacterium SCGC AG-212-F19]
MADWRKLARDLALADGKITDRETSILRRELLADRKIDHDEFQFVLELKRAAQAASPAFNQFFFHLLKKFIMRDGTISDAEARSLRQWLVVNGKIAPDEHAFLEELRKESRLVGNEFMLLLTEARQQK